MMRFAVERCKERKGSGLSNGYSLRLRRYLVYIQHFFVELPREVSKIQLLHQRILSGFVLVSFPNPQREQQYSRPAPREGAKPSPGDRSPFLDPYRHSFASLSWPLRNSFLALSLLLLRVGVRAVREYRIGCRLISELSTCRQ